METNQKLKKKYSSPKIELELYSLDESIANNCINVVSNGPQMDSHSECDDYDEGEWGISLFTYDESPKNVNFYIDTNCDCYTTGNGTYWTS